MAKILIFSRNFLQSHADTRLDGFTRNFMHLHDIMCNLIQQRAE